MNSIFEVLDEMEENYTRGTVTLGKYVSHSMYETLNRIDAYLNSKHTSGDTDSLGRPKPFFNIVSSTANIWMRATDIDRKDIRFTATKNEDMLLTFVANTLLQNWMNENQFGQFLNQWGKTLARYGSAVVKFVKKDGDLKIETIPWNRLIVDPIDFESMPVIEKIYMTPAQLRQSKYDKNIVEDIINALEPRKNLEGTQMDSYSNFIEIYEIHGNLPERYLTDEYATENKEDEYRQQMHIISKIKTRQGDKEYCLYKGREAKSPYMLTHLFEEEGRTLSIGAVEYLFDTQWMLNHTLKNQKDYLDLASRLIFQTSDTNYMGRNILRNIEQGIINIHAPNQPLTQVNNQAMNIVGLQNFALQWQQLGRELTGTPEAMRGETMPSGTPYSLGALLQQQASNLFGLMTENKGLCIEQMMQEHIIPHLKTKMDTSEEITAILEDNDIKQIDSIYVPNEAVRRYNEKYIEDVLNERSPVGFDRITEETNVQNGFATQGNQRFFKPVEISTSTWKDALKDFEWKIRVEVTNEQQDKQAVLTSLSSILQVIATNPMVLQDPNAKMIFGKILDTVGIISPIQLSNPAVQPVGGQMVGAGQTGNQMMTQ